MLAFHQALQTVQVNVLLALDVERDGHAGRFDKTLNAVGHPFRRGEALHGQNHGRAVASALEDLRLLNHLAEIRANGRDHPRLRAGSSGQHLQQRRVLPQRQVVNVGIAAVQQGGDAAPLDVTDQLLVGRGVDGQVGMTGQRRHSQHRAGKFIEADGRGFHVRA